VSLVTGDGIGVAFGKKVILAGASFAIQPGERVGLVGPNGSGKSTILRLLAGEREADDGELTWARGVRAGYLPQDILELGAGTVVESVQAAAFSREDLEAALAGAEDDLAGAQDDDTRLEIAARLAELHVRLDEHEARYGRHLAEAILFGLGFGAADLERPVAELSGGWKMRAALAGLLLAAPDLLLLDEPTNHLDVPSLEWFDDFLRRAKPAVMLVCHDREFLNRQIDRILSFEPEGLRSYVGNYESYRRQRAEEELNLELRARRLAAERAQTERFIERFRYKASKARQVQSRVKRLEKQEVVLTRDQHQTIHFRFPEVERSGGEVVRLDGVEKRFGARVVYRGLTATVGRGERVAIIGRNGAGKSTLLRLIAGELTVDGGAIRLGHNVKLAYYAQHHTDTLDPARSILDETWDLVPREPQAWVRSVLGAFLFQGDDVDKTISVLSGGERARVALARLLLVPSNLMLMDEPTNHLDLASAEALADALKSYGGTLVFVSHNKSFVNQLATRVWDVHDGGIDSWTGNLDDYLHHLAQIGRPMSGAGARASDDPGAGAGARGGEPGRESERERRQREAKARATRAARVKPIQLEIDRIEARIAELESAERRLEHLLADPVVAQDFSKAQPHYAELARGKEELQTLLAAWERAHADLAAALAELEAGG
jgi:ATP-binding cassette subfamily F protein 3